MEARMNNTGKYGTHPVSAGDATREVVFPSGAEAMTVRLGTEEEGQAPEDAPDGED